MAFVASLHVRLPDEYGSDQLVQLLAGKFAFIADPPISEMWTFYDTYDWRLFNRSLVLRHAGQELSLEHLSSGESLNGLTSHSAPEFTWDLPESPLRERLESIIKMRALLPLAEVNTRVSFYRILNADEKTVARLVYTEVRTLDVDSEPSCGILFKPVASSWLSQILAKVGQRLARIPKVSSLIQDLYVTALEQAGKKPGSYSGKMDLRLKPKKRSDSATKEILRYLFKIMKANEAGIKADIDTEFLHDYRIAIRRTRSALSQIRNVFPTEETEHFKQSFRYSGPAHKRASGS